MDMRWEYSKGGAFDGKVVCFLVLGWYLGPCTCQVKYSTNELDAHPAAGC